MGKVTVVAIGAGNRMNAYAELHPQEMRVVAVVEPNRIRRTQLAVKCGVEERNCFESWEEFLRQEKMAMPFLYVLRIIYIMSLRCWLWNVVMMFYWRNR